jgi:peroxiredoxin
VEIMKKYFSKIYLLIVLASIFIGGASAYTWNKLKTSKTSYSEDFLEPQTNVNIPFPNLGITKFSSSEVLTDYLSNRKVLLIVFSASCNACKNEIEHLKSVNLLRDTDIEIAIVGINEESSLKEVLKNYDVEFPIFDDRSSKIRDSFNLKVTPANFVVEKGVITRMWNGSSLNSKDLMWKLGLSN